MAPLSNFDALNKNDLVNDGGAKFIQEMSPLGITIACIGLAVVCGLIYLIFNCGCCEDRGDNGRKKVGQETAPEEKVKSNVELEKGATTSAGAKIDGTTIAAECGELKKTLVSEKKNDVPVKDDQLPKVEVEKGATTSAGAKIAGATITAECELKKALVSEKKNDVPVKDDQSSTDLAIVPTIPKTVAIFGSPPWSESNPKGAAIFLGKQSDVSKKPSIKKGGAFIGSGYPNTPRKICDKQPSTDFASALANFSLDLYRQIAADNKESNIFFSPLSISFALAMTYAGANGNTKLQMERVLFGGWSAKDDEVHTSYSKAMQLLNDGKTNYKLHLANRVYAHKPTIGDLLPQFTSILKKKYESELMAMDFRDEEKCRKSINDWVAEKTNRKINDLIPPDYLSPETRLVLVNAIYFKAEWKKKFNSECTRKRQFFSSANTTKALEMMNRRDERFYYNANNDYQVLGMPFVGDHLVLFIWLTYDRFGLAAMVENFTGEELSQSISKANFKNIDHLCIPKLKLVEEADLAKILKQLGMDDIFDGTKADLSNINGKKEDLYVGGVIHKAFIELNEEGVEAAAATAVVVAVYQSLMPEINFIVDHPFLFAIVDMRTTNVLFLERFTG